MSKNKTNKTKPTKENFFHKWSTIFVLSLALAIILIDATLLNVSLSTLVKDLHTDIQSLQWVITAYSLTVAALTITGGRLGDLFGRKKMFVIGAFIFAIGSLVASFSGNVQTMVVGESIIEGIGAAMMMPATASLLVSKYQGRDRGIAFGIWGGVAAASSAIGPLLGGWLTTNYSWRYGFRINVVVAVVLVLGSLLITEYRDEQEKPSLDVIGVILSALGMLSVVYGIIEASTYGWFKAKKTYEAFGQSYNFWGGTSITLYAILCGVIFLALFYLWERRMDRVGKTPLVSMKLFSNKQFVSGMTTTTIISLGQSGLIFSIPIFLQSVRGADAFNTGLALLPMSLAALIVSPIGGMFSNKLSAKRLVQVGLVFLTAGYALIFAILNVSTVAANLRFPFIILGIGMGLTMSSINNVTLSAVSTQEAGEASGVNNTMRQLGSTLGTAIMGAVMLGAISTNLVNGINDSKVIPSQSKAAINELATTNSSSIEFGGGSHIPTFIVKPIRDELTNISNIAITDASKKSLEYTVFFIGVAFISSFWLPKNVHVETEKEIVKKAKK